MANPWFRMYSEFANDPVVQSLAFEDQRHYLVILCLKCQGVLDRNLTPSNRTRIILRGLGLDSLTADEVKRRLMEVEFITDDWQPVAWDKRQFKTDLSTDRVKKHREQKSSKLLKSNTDETVSETDCYVSVSVSDSKVVNNKRSKEKFTPPTTEEVANYCYERKNNIDPEAFIAFYDSKGWKVGNQKMKSWKAAIITWEKRSANNTTTTPKPTQREKAINAFRDTQN